MWHRVYTIGDTAICTTPSFSAAINRFSICTDSCGHWFRSPSSNFTTSFLNRTRVTSNRGSASTFMVRTTPASPSGATCPASLSSTDDELLAPAGGRLIAACSPPFCPAFFGFPFFWGIQKTIKMKEKRKKAHFDVRYSWF